MTFRNMYLNVLIAAAAFWGAKEAPTPVVDPPGATVLPGNSP